MDFLIYLKKHLVYFDARIVFVTFSFSLLTHSLTHSLTHKQIHPPTHSLPTHLFTHPPTHPLTHPPTHSLTHKPLTHKPTTHSFNHPPTQSFTHSPQLHNVLRLQCVPIPQCRLVRNESETEQWCKHHSDLLRWHYTLSQGMPFQRRSLCLSQWRFCWASCRSFPVWTHPNLCHELPRCF